MLSRPLRRKRQKLSDVIVESVKRSIVTDALRPGDRLPTERELMESFQCSKGSAREALKALEVEGLVNTRTGPSGGAYLNAVGTEPASRALRNYLHFQHLDGEQVYQLRKVIEVELAVSVIGRLSAADFKALQDNVDFCSAPEDSEAGQRELGFQTYYPGRVVMGGPKQTIARIRQLRDAGITQVGLLTDFGSLPQAEIMRSLRVLADEVLPHVRDL